MQIFLDKRLFSAASESRTRSNRLKLQERIFHLGSHNIFVTVRAVWQWNQLPKEVGSDSHSLEAFKQRLNRHLWKMERICLLLAGGWTLLGVYVCICV